MHIVKRRRNHSGKPLFFTNTPLADDLLAKATVAKMKKEDFFVQQNNHVLRMSSKSSEEEQKARSLDHFLRELNDVSLRRYLPNEKI